MWFPRNCFPGQLTASKVYTEVLQDLLSSQHFLWIQKVCSTFSYKSISHWSSAISTRKSTWYYRSNFISRCFTEDKRRLTYLEEPVNPKKEVGCKVNKWFIRSVHIMLEKALVTLVKKPTATPCNTQYWYSAYFYTVLSQ